MIDRPTALVSRRRRRVVQLRNRRVIPPPAARGLDRSSVLLDTTPHQGLGNELIAPQTSSTGSGPVHCRERLGGLLKFYYREAA